MKQVRLFRLVLLTEILWRGDGILVHRCHQVLLRSVIPEAAGLEPGLALSRGPTAPTTTALIPLDPQPKGTETNLSNRSKHEKCWKIPGFIYAPPPSTEHTSQGLGGASSSDSHAFKDLWSPVSPAGQEVRGWRVSIVEDIM